MKNYPKPLQYKILDDQALADSLFLRMRRYIYGATARTEDLAENEQVILREFGKVAPNRPYFYLKPLNKSGWLFERSGSGWVVSRAEKIVEQNRFLRSYDPWDVVTLHVPEDGNGTPRVSSPRLKANLVSFPVYEQLLTEHLGLDSQRSQMQT